MNAPPSRIPRGPIGLPLLGEALEARRDVLGWLLRMAAYGPVVKYRFGPLNSYLVFHPDALKHVMQDHVKNYTKAQLSYRMLRRVVGESLFTSDGETWLQQRRLAQPAFHRARISAMAARMVRATQDLEAQWAESQRSGEPRSLMGDMMALTLRIVGEALLGTDVRADTEAVSEAFTVISEQTIERLNSLWFLPPVLPTAYDRTYRQANRTLKGVVDRIISQRRERLEDQGDLLSMFMLARDEETGARMDDEHVRNEALTMLLAGHETTANALSWAWTLLQRNPDAERRMHEELEAVLGGRPPGAEDVPKLVYTRRVLDETLRLYPPVYSASRLVVEDDTLCGYEVRGGRSLYFSPYVTHRLPEFWPDPEHFEPDRFTPERVAARPRFAYLPFLGGPRQCIGNNFALMEGTLILATLAQRYRPRLVEADTPAPEPLLTLRPKGELPVVITAR